MGIPSYYKRLIDRFPKLVSKGVKLATGARKADILLMDFNCLIYQCVRSEKLPPYGAEGREAWEGALIEEVKRYTVDVWDVAGRPSEVVIAVDGVVPMAKMRQQRLRRFKSLWLAAAEREAGVRSGEAWDTNAITPGTAFMEALGRGLQQLCRARGSGWAVSGADEPGEGEQKLMAWMRRQEAGRLAKKEVVVYGLDADLILLSLLCFAKDTPQVAGWRLLRELAEFEGGSGSGGGGFGSLDIGELLSLLVPYGIPSADYMMEYVCGMSFLGNDFLPHSLSVKIREGGHDLLCSTLTSIHTEKGRLVGPEGRVNLAACAGFLRRWAAEEEAWIKENFAAKYKGRGPPPRNERERAMLNVTNLPLEWKEEGCIWSRESGGRFVDDWREIYRRRWLREADVGEAAREYVKGLQWIMDYYTGKPVSYDWYFPWNVPPLWSDILGACEAGASAPEPTSPVAPQEQLAMVLPLGSWWLVREPRLRALPARAPVYWPSGFGFFSAGRRWMWECEAEVPILTAERMRGLLMQH